MIERLETTLKKYNELSKELTKPEVLSDIKKTREYSKEMAALEDIVTCYKKYKKVLSDIEDNKEMLNFSSEFCSKMYKEGYDIGLKFDLDLLKK